MTSPAQQRESSAFGSCLWASGGPHPFLALAGPLPGAQLSAVLPRASSCLQGLAREAPAKKGPSRAASKEIKGSSSWLPAALPKPHPEHSLPTPFLPLCGCQDLTGSIVGAESQAPAISTFMVILAGTHLTLSDSAGIGSLADDPGEYGENLLSTQNSVVPGHRGCQGNLTPRSVCASGRFDTCWT